MKKSKPTVVIAEMTIRDGDLAYKAQPRNDPTNELTPISDLRKAIDNIFNQFGVKIVKIQMTKEKFQQFIDSIEVSYLWLQFCEDKGIKYTVVEPKLKWINKMMEQNNLPIIQIIK